MHDMTYEEAAMLCESGYHAAFIESIKDGDDIAIKVSNSLYFGHKDGEYDHGRTIIFATVKEVGHLDAYDAFGERESAHFLVKFIMIDEKGVQTPQTYGRSYPVYIKDHAAVDVSIEQGSKEQ